MSQQKVMILNVAVGGWYPKGLARLIREFDRVSPGFEITSWVNCYPPGTPEPGEWPDDGGGCNYRPYIAKPFAMKYALDQGADVAILLDAAFYPIRAIHPLIEHICQRGYYLCRNGNQVGEWASDEALRMFSESRRHAFTIPEASSYCVGMNLKWSTPAQLVEMWAEKWRAIPGPHSQRLQETAARNPGFVSTDPRVRGHRHDQTTLSLLAHHLGMDELIERPLFTAYRGSETEETVLVNHGGFE